MSLPDYSIVPELRPTLQLIYYVSVKEHLVQGHKSHI